MSELRFGRAPPNNTIVAEYLEKIVPHNQSLALPEVTPAETVDEIVVVSHRTGFFPLRREFLQRLDGDLNEYRVRWPHS